MKRFEIIIHNNETDNETYYYSENMADAIVLAESFTDNEHYTLVIDTFIETQTMIENDINNVVYDSSWVENGFEFEIVKGSIKWYVPDNDHSIEYMIEEKPCFETRVKLENGQILDIEDALEGR